MPAPESLIPDPLYNAEKQASALIAAAKLLLTYSSLLLKASGWMSGASSIDVGADGVAHVHLSDAQFEALVSDTEARPWAVVATWRDVTRRDPESTRHSITINDVVFFTLKMEAANASQ